MKVNPVINLLVFSILLPLCISVYGQKDSSFDYIQTLDNNFVYGTFDDSPQQGERVIFKPSNQSEFQLLTPTDILSFRKDGKIMESHFIKLDSQKHFITKLIGGSKSLYQYKSLGGNNFYIMDHDELLLLVSSKENAKNYGDIQATLINPKYKGQLNYYLRECPSIHALTTKYSKTSLLRLFEKYYKCVSQKLDYIYVIKKPKVDIDLLVGASYLAYKFDLINHTENVISPTIGLAYESTLPETIPNWSLRGELNASRFKTKSTYPSRIVIENVTTQPNAPDNREINEQIISNSSKYDALLISVNFLACYKIIYTPTQSLFFRAGISNTFGKKFESPIDFYEQYIDAEYAYSVDRSPQLDPHSWGGVIAIGYSYKEFKIASQINQILGPFTNYERREDSVYSRMTNIAFLFSYNIK